MFASSLLVSAQLAVQPGADLPLQSGNPAAEFKIEIFNDYACPSCATYFKKLRDLEERYPDKVLITYRNFPLMIPSHAGNVQAARAVEAAGRQGRSLQMMELVYKGSSKWAQNEKAEDVFIRYARSLGLDVTSFTADMHSEDIATRIELDMERAKSLKLNSTPSFFLNDKQLPFAEAQNIEDIISKGNK